MRINTEELNLLKIKNKIFQRMRNRGFKKNKLSHWFSEVKYSSRAKYLGVNPGIFVISREREKRRQIPSNQSFGGDFRRNYEPEFPRYHGGGFRG